MLLSPANFRCAPITNSLGSSREVKNSTWNNIISIKNNHKEIKPMLSPKLSAGSPIYKSSTRIDNPLPLPPKPPEVHQYINYQIRLIVLLLIFHLKYE